MLELLSSHIEYWHWIVAGLLIATAEIFVPSFVMLFLGVSAVLIGLLMLVVPISFSTQLSIWGISSALLVFFWHRFVAPKMQDRTLAGLSKEAIIGQAGTVLSYNEIQGRGTLRFPAPVLGNDEWEFLFTGSLKSGDKVRVIELSGNSLIVSFYE